MTASAKRSVAEYVLNLLLGWIPRPIGSKLRNFVYRWILADIGHGLYICRDVELIGAQNIQLEDGVSLARQVQIDANTPNAKVYLGKRVMLDRGVDVNTVAGFEGCEIEFGANTYVGPYACFAGPGNITIGEDCLIASHSGIYANNHRFEDPTCPIRQQGLSCKGIVIGNDCWLGSGVKVLDGVTIGEGCVVGAGAVVTKNLPPYTIAVGIPAKAIGKRSI